MTAEQARATPLPEHEEEWAETFRSSGYEYCRPHEEWHRPPECPIDEHGEPAPTWADPD